MPLQDKYNKEEHIIEQIYEIRREQIQFNDTVYSALMNRNNAVTGQFIIQEKSSRLLVSLAGVIIALNTAGLLMLILLLVGAGI